MQHLRSDENNRTDAKEFPLDLHPSDQNNPQSHHKPPQRKEVDGKSGHLHDKKVGQQGYRQGHNHDKDLTPAPQEKIHHKNYQNGRQDGGAFHTLDGTHYIRALVLHNIDGYTVRKFGF